VLCVSFCLACSAVLWIILFQLGCWRCRNFLFWLCSRLSIVSTFRWWCCCCCYFSSYWWCRLCLYTHFILLFHSFQVDGETLNHVWFIVHLRVYWLTVENSKLNDYSPRAIPMDIFYKSLWTERIRKHINYHDLVNWKWQWTLRSIATNCAREVLWKEFYG
jgi:hypothetical protein